MNEIWIEKFRPSTFKEVVGQDKIVQRIKAFVEQKNLPNILFSGPAGCGKTSLILVAVQELYGKSWRENVLETNASMDRGIQIVREDIKNFSRTMPLSNAPFKIVILDEADALTREAQQALRRTMEQYSSNVRFCLIANFSSKLIDPIQSRCTIFRFKPLEKKDIEKIIENVAKIEGLKVDKEAIDALYELSEGDVRRVENVLQSCSVISKKITQDLIYDIVSAAKPKEIKQVLELCINKNFIRARDLLLEVMLKHGLSGIDIIKQIQKEILSLDIKDEKKLEMVERCGEIEFRLVEGSDEFIQIESLLANFSK